jgi:hypothetical protein
MRLYRTKVFYFSGLANEPGPPQWPQDYHEPEELVQQGTGQEALDNAFRQCHAMGRDMEVGDVVGLDDGSLHRCEASGWIDIGKLWTVRVQQGQQRKLG